MSSLNSGRYKVAVINHNMCIVLLSVFSVMFLYCDGCVHLLNVSTLEWKIRNIFKQPAVELTV